jgi:hypothetical protein
MDTTRFPSLPIAVILRRIAALQKAGVVAVI